MQIGPIKFSKNPLFLAPMEDVTDPAFRILCKRFGADMVYTEFVSAEALIRNIPRTEQKLFIHEEERPIAIQLYGRDIDPMVQAAKIAELANANVIDINFGCPVKKVAGKGAGAGLLKDIPKMLDITASIVKSVKIPVTVKTRLGWDDSSKPIVDLAVRLQDCGISALTIHGRTRAQMYKGDADWSLIGEVKNNPVIKIPIIGNGDVTSAEQAKCNFDKYGVDAIMIGRASIGRPWIFSEIKHFFNTGENIEVLTFKEKKEVLKEHILSSVQWLDGDSSQLTEDIFNKRLKGIIHCRRHLAATPVFKGITNFKETRIAMLRTDTLNELFDIIDNIEI
jgi:tRNA-dihydrouridine synthase B